MSDKSNEQISNLMDGELEVNASRFLLKRMASDDSLSNTWDNYHRIKSCLQKEANVPTIDVAKKVTHHLLNESNDSMRRTHQSQKTNVHKWLKPIMGLGIAASVAFMSVVMLQKQQIQGIDNAPMENQIANLEVTNPILKTNITATTAASDRTLMPPPSLSRFPSVSSQQNVYNQEQFYSSQRQAPYIIFINKASATDQEQQLSPIRIQDISD